MAILQDYELDEMRKYSDKYASAVETVESEVGNMIKTVIDASDSNTAAAVRQLTDTFSQKVKIFLEIPNQVKEVMGSIVKETERYDESVGGGH